MTDYPQAEISWFSALCDDDYQFLGVEDPSLKASWPHCRDIALTAEKNGFDNILLPSGYTLGMDSVGFAGGIAPLLEKTLDGGPRYQRTREIMQALRQFLNGEAVNMDGEHIRLELEPPRMQTASGKCPPFYFGGLSPAARDVAAAEADVFLMWPDTMDKVAEILDDMRARADNYDRTLKFGYRAHVIVRETEAEARAAADKLISKLDDSVGEEIRNRSLDSASYGVRRQAEMRDAANAAGAGDYVEDNLWTGVGRARSGCGAAIVGDPDQVLAKLNAYRDLGVEAFILSGYPHKDECDLFGKYVLPQLNHGPLAI